MKGSEHLLLPRSLKYVDATLVRHLPDKDLLDVLLIRVRTFRVVEAATVCHTASAANDAQLAGSSTRRRCRRMKAHSCNRSVLTVHAARP